MKGTPRSKVGTVEGGGQRGQWLSMSVDNAIYTFTIHGSHCHVLTRAVLLTVPSGCMSHHSYSALPTGSAAQPAAPVRNA